jgi:hypothetical protein
VQYFEIRKMLELAILEELPVQTYILDNPDYNWEQLWVKLKEVLDKV